MRRDIDRIGASDANQEQQGYGGRHPNVQSQQTAAENHSALPTKQDYGPLSDTAPAAVIVDIERAAYLGVLHRAWMSIQPIHKFI